MALEGFKCQRCAKCCGPKYIGSMWLTEAEVEEWRKYPGTVKSNYGPTHPLKFAEVSRVTRCADLFFHPTAEDHHELQRCPFLRKLPNKPIFKCLIHDLDNLDIRPRICREFPTERELEKETECPEVRRLRQGLKYARAHFLKGRGCF